MAPLLLHKPSALHVLPWQMHACCTLNRVALCPLYICCRPAQLISAEKLYPGGSFAEYRTALAAASRNKAVTPAATTGDRAAPSWINNYSNSFGTDKTNGTYMQYTFLKSGNCVTYDSAYLSASAENMCYGAFGVARAQLKTTVDEKAFSRVTSWDGTIWMVLRGTVFGADVDILEYDVKAGAGDNYVPAC